ncbi:T9SS type A sorting domain-containing protein [uncultured Parabacteroides sp.]|uniref:T9SS type A sorting domain-containing protein n=1 Tax=uncultured Parabacteroides sp. TaxID=512312 RepID=UPI0026106521|nr:T9SS type A sorting domain-containing protein [uncultured Parabacteroides sp.]
MPKSWYGNDTVIKNTASSISVTPDYFTDGMIKVRGINPEYEKDKTAFSSITVKREFNYSAYPATIQYGVSQTFTYTVPAVSGVAYEWSVPSGWTIVSGANTNSIRVTKSPCATSADVKVRLKNGNKYSGWFMAPNTTVLPPNLTIPSIEQFRDISISVDIPSDKIESFTITGTGVSIAGGKGTNTLVCRFDNVGSQEINISLKLKECGSSYTLKKTVDVSKIQLEITGLDGICPSSQTYNYSISDLPAGATVSWSCGNHISIVGSSSGNNCSVKGTSGGGSAIFAHVTVRGVTVRIDKDVVVSTPLNDPYAKVSIDYSKESNNKLMLIAKLSQIYGVLGFIWNATPIGTGNSYSTQTGPSGDYWTIPNGNYNIELRVITHCGLLLQTRAVYGVGSYAFSVYPNPADRTLFVDVAEPEKTISADEAVWAPKTASTSYELRLFNFQGLLVRNLRMTDRQVSIDVSGLPGGNYFLHIFRDGVAEPEVHKVIVSH